MLILSSCLEKIWKEHRRKCLQNYQLHKNPSLHFKEHCIKIDDISLIFVTNLLFKFNSVLYWLVYWIVFTTIYLPFYLLIIDILRILSSSTASKFWWGWVFLLSVFFFLFLRCYCLFFSTRFLKCVFVLYTVVHD